VLIPRNNLPFNAPKKKLNKTQNQEQQQQQGEFKLPQEMQRNENDFVLLSNFYGEFHF